jgi:acyl-CoA synthetase (AMP-forming)/AMP-acid ligase II
VTSVIPGVDLRRPGSVDPARVVAEMQGHGVTTSAASPAFFDRVARHCLARGVRFPALRKLFTGGAPVFPRLLDQLQEVAPRAEVVAVYGSTEAEPIAQLARHQVGAGDREAMAAGKGLLAGAPVPQVRLRILPDRCGTPLGPFNAAEFDAECLAPHQPGEIVVSGEHVLAGYLHGVGDREAKLRVDGAVWHRTGDAGYLDGEGRLWLLGRCSARVVDRRGVVYPLSAEASAYLDPRVRRAALVAHAGKRILALEYYDRGQAPALDVLRGALLDEVRVCREIPVDPRHNGKVDYRRLRHSLGIEP